VFVDIGPRTFNIDPALLETEVARIEAERTSRQVFSLPMHPYLSDDEIDGIVNVITHAVS
jgi:dTDP-4-amino-4,6-dideoxygalactose transaminase